ALAGPPKLRSLSRTARCQAKPGSGPGPKSGGQRKASRTAQPAASRECASAGAAPRSHRMAFDGVPPWVGRGGHRPYVGRALHLDTPVNSSRERIFNVPSVVVAVLAVTGLIHLLLAFILSDDATTELLLLFAFIPARYQPSLLPGDGYPGGLA